LPQLISGWTHVRNTFRVRFPRAPNSEPHIAVTRSIVSDAIPHGYCVSVFRALSSSIPLSIWGKTSNSQLRSDLFCRRRAISFGSAQCLVSLVRRRCTTLFTFKLLPHVPPRQRVASMLTRCDGNNPSWCAAYRFPADGRGGLTDRMVAFASGTMTAGECRCCWATL